ncbi:YebG family protein [Serratia marcescens]|uniref:YebG family protein n=1 Tax=Serratia marcescens TaxID=615 RepID=UPI002753D33A|nr:YebG family protein [Serratia marcescens]MDP8600638.1 YebG family protein [Serratia marcescens]MDP8685338.1 YebG family protein [Serratia marcescens]MDP8734919.1 YebG family protein [Serratia marcescens]MDP8794236.1 YebG family protein [Serratia marcescens]HEJ7833829.1 YebG family protein [Serratia marcescens]
MAVEVKYVVVRNGEEKMTFASKKEADAYDKMLDLADNLGEWLQQAPLNLDDEQREGLSFFLAENKDALGLILRGASPAETGKKPTEAKAKKTVANSKEGSTSEKQAA